MAKPFGRLTLEQFANQLSTFPFRRAVTAVHMHHTWSPAHTDYAGLPTIDGMWAFHTAPPPHGRGWSDIAQHLSIAPDGSIWTGRDWNSTPASATGFNTGAFMFETIGNFDVGHDVLQGPQRRAVVEVIASVQLKFGLPLESLHFHREFTDQKSCPGTGVQRADILNEVRAARERLRSGERTFAVAGATSRAASVYGFGGQGADVGTSGERPFAESELDAPRAGGAPAVARDVGPDEGEPSCGAADATRDVAGTPESAAARGGLLPGDLAALRPYVVNLRQGRFSTGGIMDTTPADVDAMFGVHLPRALEDAQAQGERLRLLFWAHGGLVSESAGLTAPRELARWWRANHVYPVYFVWETGLWETLAQLLSGRRELTVARDLADFSDHALEEVARRVGGGKIWDGMKYSAERSVGPEGGAAYVAYKLAEFCKTAGDRVELHAVGHSAGSIFHSFFIPAARRAGASTFRTVSFLAPAIRVDAFLERLAPLLATGQGIDALTLFTMSKDYERADNCGKAYRKSLLYLVRSALEARRGDAILGLEESLRADPKLQELFGLEGQARGTTPHTVVWSRTPETGGREASLATAHGAFDNDRATMESVLRRVRGLGDDTAVEPFPESAARTFRFDEASEAGELSLPNLASAAPAPEPPGPPPSPAPATRPPTPNGPHNGKRGRKVALCVGIDAYPSGAALSGCVADATLWAKRLQELGFETDLLLNEHATEAGIVSAITRLFGNTQPGDVLVFQYAGHGTSFPDRDADEPDEHDEALVPVDFDSGHFILDDEQFQLFDALPDGVALTCFYDCCHSGTMARFALENLVREIRAEDAAEPVKARFINPTPAMLAEYAARRAARRSLRAAPGGTPLRDAESMKAVAFAACRDDEVALERGGQGVFTGYVTRLLREAYAGQVTNADFQQRITQAFGPNPSQHPGLDGAVDAKSRPLLGARIRDVVLPDGVPGVPTSAGLPETPPRQSSAASAGPTP